MAIFARCVTGVFTALIVFGSLPVAASERGRETNLPIPRYVSMKASEANVRRGPSLTHRIDWVFHRRNTPLEVTAEYGHWRRIRDADGAGGWVHYTLLSGVRHVVIKGAEVTLRDRPSSGARAVAMAEDGAIAKLGDCLPDWCEVTSDRARGWISKAEIWGVDSDELRD